ncbi:MAG TPA: flagellar biosynthetic protein FliO [Terriglobales bacterium]|jgi:flagellar protein FliO/FliZ|nr:flagellar biosynthetic protein FliO [Terriglobales bacterium]
MTPGPTDQLTSINSQVVQYIGVLLALGGVLLLAYVLLRVGLPRLFGMRTSSGGPIQVVARYPLEPKKTLYLLRIGTQVFLIGTSESQVQFLTSLAADNLGDVFQPREAKEVAPKDFRQILGWFQKGGQG